MIAVANAPCSWGVLEFESKTASPGYAQVLDEIAAVRICRHRARRLGFHAHRARRFAGASSTGGGSPWSARLSRRGWPIPVRTTRACSTAVETARLLAAVGDGGRPVIVLSDEPTADPVAHGAAGRVQPDLSLTGRQWDDAARGVERIARAVRDETGLRTVFHHHCAGYVETPDEIDALHAADRSVARRPVPRFRPCDVRRRLAARVAVAPPRAHVARPLQGLRAADCRARAGGSSGTTRRRFVTACSASWGAAASIFPRCSATFRHAGYDGWIVVEQDVLPAMGSPVASPDPQPTRIPRGNRLRRQRCSDPD